jgi:hypothetical protein
MENGNLKYDKTTAHTITHSYTDISTNVNGVSMGEITFIQNKIATIIHDDGSTSSTPVDRCDYCDEWASQVGGLTIRDVGLEAVTWLCAACRA